MNGEKRGDVEIINHQFCFSFPFPQWLEFLDFVQISWDIIIPTKWILLALLNHISLFRMKKGLAIFEHIFYIPIVVFLGVPNFTSFPFFLSLPLLSSLARIKSLYISYEVSYYYKIKNWVFVWFWAGLQNYFFLKKYHIFIDNTMKSWSTYKWENWVFISRFIGWSLAMTKNVI